MKVSDVANGLRPTEEGYWAAPGVPEVSYPVEGSDFCFAIEDGSFWFRHRNRLLTTVVQQFAPPAGPLLDVGAGNGCVASALHAASIRVVAIEPGAQGARRCIDRGIPLVIRSTFPDEHFIPGAAGGIGLFDVLEHIPDDKDYLRSLRPMLKPGGKIYLTVPAYGWLWSQEDLVAGHQRRYTLTQIERLLAESGFTVDFSSYIFWWLPLAIFIFRRLPYLLSSSKRQEFSPSAKQHTVGGSLMRRLMLASFIPEILLIRQRISVPWGASCLAVASLPPRGTPQDALEA